MAMTAACSSSSPKPAQSPTPVRIPTTAMRLCHEPYASDVSWVTTRSGWLLEGQQCRRAAKFRSRLYLTSDAGHHWTRRRMPATRTTRIAFADDRIGYAFGPTTWLTTDGAKSWHRIAGRPTTALAVDGGYAYRVTYSGSGCPGPCRLRVERSVTGSTVWRTVDLPPYSGDGAHIAASGPAVLVTLPGNPAGGAGSAHTLYLESDDAGTSWRWHTDNDPCGGVPHQEWDSSDVALRGSTIAALCTARLTQADGTLISHDLGGSWTARRPVPFRWAGIIGVTQSNYLIGAGMTGANGGATYVVAVSTDDGTTWQTAVTAPSYASNPNIDIHPDIECAGSGCVVLVDPHLLFVTGDNGRSWASPSLPT
ncbi:MAG: hypothetical protein ACTHK4_15790 [Mycobacteriales bacterium]